MMATSWLQGVIEIHPERDGLLSSCSPSWNVVDTHFKELGFCSTTSKKSPFHRNKLFDFGRPFKGWTGTETWDEGSVSLPSWVEILICQYGRAGWTSAQKGRV